MAVDGEEYWYIYGSRSKEEEVDGGGETVIVDEYVYDDDEGIFDCKALLLFKYGYVVFIEEDWAEDKGCLLDLYIDDYCIWDGW